MNGTHILRVHSDQKKKENPVCVARYEVFTNVQVRNIEYLPSNKSNLLIILLLYSPFIPMLLQLLF